MLAWIALMMVKRLLTGLVRFVTRRNGDEEFGKRTKTLGQIVNYALMLVIVSVAVMTVLREFGIDIGPVLAAAGIVGLAVGFGAQSLVKDVISGFFILLEDQIRVGDVVNIAGKSGLVEKVSLRTTVLRDMAGNVHYVPNGLSDSWAGEFEKFSFTACGESLEDSLELMRFNGNDPRGAMG